MPVPGFEENKKTFTKASAPSEEEESKKLVTAKPRFAAADLQPLNI